MLVCVLFHRSVTLVGSNYLSGADVNKGLLAGSDLVSVLRTGSCLDGEVCCSGLGHAPTHRHVDVEGDTHESHSISRINQKIP